MRTGLFFVCALVVLLAGCPRNEAPRITSLVALPDSVTRSGVAQLSCAAEDPEGGAVSISWQARLGEVRPDSGSGPIYIAPNLNTEDTISVTVTDEAGRTAESTLVITVAEGLCGGRPEFLTSSYASALAADSHRVYHAKPTAPGYELRWVEGATGDSGVLFASPGWPLEVAYHAGRVWVLERVLTGPPFGNRILSVARTGGPVDTLVEFLDNVTWVKSLAVGPEGVCYTWYEDTTGRFASCIGLVPLAGGPVDTLRAVTGSIADGPVLGPVALHEGSVVYLVAADSAGGSQVRRYDVATRTDVLLAVKGAPEVPSVHEPLAVVDGVAYWGEREQGRIGAVGLDGSNPRYLLDAGGPAASIKVMVAAPGLGGSGTRVFWSVPGDLRALVVPSGDVLLDLDRGSGTVIAMCANDRFVFFTYDDGFVGRLYRVMIP
jgi:hypothetical protein